VFWRPLFEFDYFACVVVIAVLLILSSFDLFYFEFANSLTNSFLTNHEIPSSDSLLILKTQLIYGANRF
jgi:hypothetical protein